MSSFKLTDRQIAANSVLGSAATHAMLFGGSRSGKTFVIMRAIMVRALRVEKTRHVALRYRFNHIKASIIFDTLPKMVDLCFPGLAARSELNKTDWFYKLPNGSEIWFGGLDDKERTEKILGQEYSTIFLNECSQIGWQSRNMAMTRLAQNSALKLRAYYDCNPPFDTHWTNKFFNLKEDPDSRRKLPNPENVASLQINPSDNRANLPASYLAELQALPEKMRRRFYDGAYTSAIDGALWTLEDIDKWRVDQAPQLQRIIIAVDPSGCQGEEDERSDEVGIVVVGLGDDGDAYVLEDLSGKFGPSQWGKIVASAFDRHEADAVVGETNYGGAMVGQVVRAARPGTPFKALTASRGKHVRAEPVAALYEQGKVRHVGRLMRLEDQLTSFTTAGYMGDRSPDRADALVWGLSELFPAMTRKEPKQIDLGAAAFRPPAQGSSAWMG